ncbi:MAG: hypothetical protein KatS3mg068_1920 [Candidatus Sericytochromatia bacterium]|nr:MAG: hypothetical protein KatS3mg068_1920 [Candidatus Sericytochromatia bacterium]
MDISNLTNINNLIPSVITPSLPNKVVEQKVPQQKLLTETSTTQENKQKINFNLQSFSNILLEIGFPNTTQNIQLANILANYGQAINKQTMNEFSQALGNLMNKGSLSMEAGVVLLLNGLELSKNNIEAVKQLLSGGGLSQNLISLNKDLQKMISSLSGQDLRSQISQAIINKEIEEKNKLEKINQNENNIEKVNLKNNLLEENKVFETTQVRKNPFEDLENKEEFLENTSKQITKLGNEINKNIINILTIDVLKNPSIFPMQIAMLKKYFFDLEKDIDELKKILKNIFGEIDEDAENIFTELLKLVVDEKFNNKNKNTNNIKNENILKEIYKSLNSINLNFIARDLLNKPNESMCLPLFIQINNNIINAELMITREDKSNKKNEIGNIPLKIQLLMETSNLGKVSIEMNSLKKDLQINILLENEKIKNLFKEKIYLLENNLKELPFDIKPIQCNINRKQNHSNSILLPQKYKVMSMKRIEGIM